MILKIKEHFSAYPGGRYASDGPNSAEHFRRFLVKSREELIKLNQFDGKLILDFSGVYPMGSSFIEEAFAGLIRIGKRDLYDQLEFMNLDGFSLERIHQFVGDQIAYNLKHGLD